MDFAKKIKHILYVDSFVTTHKAEESKRSQEGIALIAAAAFAVMSLLNIKQSSFVMLQTTSLSGLFLLIGFMISRYKNHSAFLRIVFYTIFVVVFTAYTVEGGNEGFAALWLITATYAVMIAIDFKVGFIISAYYLIMLLLTFTGPLSELLRYDYNKTFMLRFPFLYAINFAFATYIVICVRMYQYELLIKKQELEDISKFDLSTGLRNRNYFVQYEQEFKSNELSILIAVFIDVNGLHDINNQYGHDAGDRMLRFVADMCKECFFGHAVFRMGGDEFLIVCENTGENVINEAAQKLFDQVEQEGYSISYGIAVQKSDFNLTKIVKCADEKMLMFKKEYYGLKVRNM